MTGDIDRLRQYLAENESRQLEFKRATALMAIATGISRMTIREKLSLDILFFIMFGS